VVRRPFLNGRSDKLQIGAITFSPTVHEVEDPLASWFEQSKQLTPGNALPADRFIRRCRSGKPAPPARRLRSARAAT